MTTPALTPELLARHGEFVRALARSLLADEHAADDVAQEAWLRYAKEPPRNALDPRGWLAVVVRNLARNSGRAARARGEREAAVARAEASASHEEAIAQADALRSVVDAVLALDEPYRGTVLARYFRGLEPAQIASESGVPVTTVKSRLQRAHAELRTRLDREHGSRAQWAVALGGLAGLESAAPMSIGIAALAKTAGIAALFVAAAVWAWRTAADESAAQHDASAALATSDGERATPVELVATADDRAAAPTATAPSDATTFVARGRVRDVAYEPLALAGGPAVGAEVEARLVTHLGFSGKLLGSARASTAEDGSFALALAQAPAQPCWLIVTTPPTAERRGAYRQFEIAAGSIARDDIELARAAHGLADGAIVDADGAPLPNARVRLRWDGTEPREAELAADELGLVRTPHAGELVRVDALDAGAVVMHFEAPRQRESGGSSGMRIVIARGASLTVRVVDAEQRGIAGATVAVMLADSERRRVREAAREGESFRGDTSADGRVELAGLAADAKLVVTITLDNDSQQSASTGANELVFGPESAAPIVLAPGERRELVAHWRGALTIAGTTSSPDGARIPNANVEITRATHDSTGYTPPLARLKSDAQGEFTARVRARELDTPLEIVAAQTGSARAALGGLGYIGSSGPTDGAVGRAALDPRDAESGVLRADVVLEPTFTIEGRVLDAEGNAVTRTGLGASRLWAVPAGSPSHRAGGDGLGRPGAKLEADGSCLFFGLTRGDWDLYVSREIQSFYTWESFVDAFPSVPAGARNVELRLAPGGEVRVRVKLMGGDADELTVLHARLMPNDPVRPKQAAPKSQRVASVATWPVGATLGFNGISGHADELGAWADGFYSTDETREHALQPMGAGWYVIGVAPARADGSRRWFPLASELFWYEPGDYEIEFELAPVCELRGRVLGDARAEHLAVELRTLDGARIPLENLPGFGRPVHVLDTDARGGFVIRDAPVGRFVLRAGTRAELERGEFRRELAVELVEGENAPLDVTLR